MLANFRFCPGSANGLRSIQLAGRTTRVTACPWSTRKDIFELPEGNKPAVYILVADDPDGTDLPAVYIGECDSFFGRFKSKHHAENRAEWFEVYVATSTDEILNKAHTLFAEDLLCKQADRGGLSRVLTERSSPPTLDEGDQGFATAFAEDVAVLTKVLGLGVFLKPNRQKRPTITVSLPDSPEAISLEESVTHDDQLPVFEFRTKGVRGLMQPIENEFVLIEGSKLAKDEAPKIPPKASRTRAEGLAAGQIKDAGAFLEVVKSIPLKSVPLAAQIVSGSSVSGNETWVVQGTSETYPEWSNRRNMSENAADNEILEEPNAPVA